MIRHCAFFRFRKDVSSQKIQQLLEAFIALGPKLEGLATIHVGPNVSPEGLDRGFRHGLVMDFITAEACNAYLNHPDHVSLAKRLVACLDGGIASGVIAFDLEL